VTLLRPISVATLLMLTPAPVAAADASPHPPPSSPAQAGEGKSIDPSALAGEVALPSPLAAQSLDRLSATRARPLFSPTRRPPAPPPPVVVAPEPPPPPPDVALFGIVMDGDGAQAVVRAGPADKIVRVRVGDDIGGWKVAQIDGRRLILSLDDRIATFLMFAGNSANGAPRTGPEAPAANTQSPGQTQPQNQMRQNDPAPSDPQSPRATRSHRSR